MDKGAHFHRSDFQVHSARDLQWKGERPKTEDERKVYAAEFVAACRQRGIQAVAITDHHDMESVEYIRVAAAGELDGSGNPLPPHRKLVVFPGMELTLGVPCQAIVIFDANLPADLFSLVYAALNLQPNSKEEEKTAATQRLEAIRELPELQKKLDSHTYLKSRYIILPNVSDGGSDTLLRSGFHSHYNAMSCVGGYLDGAYSQMGTGNRNILEGRDVKYGHKALGVFQTSDCRSRDFETLGQPSTWVKWAEPTAEALRQACLAKASRLSHEEPMLPASYITSISVGNSKFLGPVTLDLNRQFNAIIGGRGTGKSSILEYLRWALCDEPVGEIDEVDAGDYRVKRQKLIDKTLKDYNTTVQIGFVVGGVPHAVRRHSKDSAVLLKIGEGEFEPATEEQIRAILPIQGYSQKQLSSVSVKSEQLQRFIRIPVREKLEDAERALSSTVTQLSNPPSGT